MRIRWTPEAFSNLETILLYIEQGNPEATPKTADDIYHRLEQLATFPNRGRTGREAGHRELVYRRYRTSPFTAHRKAPSKSCVSGTARRIGADTKTRPTLNRSRTTAHACFCQNRYRFSSSNKKRLATLSQLL